jgi:hypothetical protein
MTHRKGRQMSHIYTNLAVNERNIYQVFKQLMREIFTSF